MTLTRITVLPLLFCLFLAAAGCGKRGALIRPEALVPAPITDLAATQRGNFLQVSWSAPTKEEGGARLKDLAGFVLFRRVVLPSSQDCDTCPEAYTERARVGLDYLKDVTRAGNRYLFDDYDLKADQTYQYKIRSVSTEGTESRDSNRTRRRVVVPPLPPVLEAASSPSAVVLSFVAIPPEQGKLAGYNIYRGEAGKGLPLSPLNATPVSANVYEDKTPQIGVTYSYSVRSVALLPGGETVESAPSNVAEGSLQERD
ncbi:lipoprotein [Geomonas silvestris]|uniref:Lipoprotein n=1 Tax=Geomonas silvestris TaxID=2740184 RepID=A0A6V8MGN8_9BACT|nr:fibronectin type III domain-containing protein [Geomonas silvestris]GFO59151.1 lipoprotein [Geomonas silvestris]